MSRLKEIKKFKGFITHEICQLTYLPMNKYYETNCPNCNPIDSDEDYIKSQGVIIEEINQDELFNSQPKFKRGN